MKLTTSFLPYMLAALLCLSSNLRSSVTAQQVNELCTDANWALDFTACLLDNACICSNCDGLDDPDVDAAIEANGGNPLTCAQVNELWCPWVRCCSQCWESRQTYLQCTFIGLYSEISLVEGGCQLDCGGYPTTGVEDEDCTDGCGQEWADHISCRIDTCDDAATTQCEVENEQEFSEASIFLAFGLGTGCGVIDDIICPDTSCCPACQTTLANYIQCIFELDGEDSTNCDLSCATFNGGGSDNGQGGGNNDPNGTDDENDAATTSFGNLLVLAISAGLLLVQAW